MSTAVVQSKTNYVEQGFEIVPNAFSKKHLGCLAQTLRAGLTRNHTCGAGLSLEELILAREAEDHSLIYKASQSVGSSTAAYDLLGSGILDAVCDLAGFDPANLHLMPMYLIVQLPHSEKFDYGWHQDGAYYDWCQDLVALWFPINRAVRAETGTISVIPKSHLDGRRETHAYTKHGFFRQLDAKLQEDESAKEHMIELEPGDCCIMNGNLVHRSVANGSDLPRVAGVVRLAYLGKGTPYQRDQFYCVHKS